MVTPLLPLGGAALGSMACQALRDLQPGQFLKQLLSGSDHKSAAAATSTSHNPAIVVEKLDLSRALPSLAQTLQQRLLAAGVDLTEPIVLKEDGRGGIVVDGDHQDRGIIEQVLATDSRLRSEFLAVAAAATTERDSLNPLSDSSLREFRLRIERGAATIEFE